MKIKSGHSLCATNLFLSLYLFCGNAGAQNRLNSLSDKPATLKTVSADTTSSSSLDNSDLPDAPQAPISGPVAVQEGVQTKRILGIFPNFRAVSANTHLPPQTVLEKFKTASQDSFDYSSIFLPAAVAGINQATNSTPEFRQGAAGYGRYYWHAFVDQAVENYTVEAIFPVVFRQDNRYYTLGHGGFMKRAGYSLSRVVITRNDAGNDTFNISEIVGAGAGAGLSNLYYPSRERTLGNTVSKWGSNVGIDAGTFLFHEFWPDINHKLFHGKQPSQ
ncbi:hypothetical protein HDF10_002171 [Edaphobacter lichenicola]|uniref:Uncharacterized protein n=2 Tax=Tunturiibacter TaxID=3154218 RepID=A0A7W8N378_9BACT|nr:hypothetical protein [Edaphobacter lichenicola]